jgi:hypothetical protein
MREHGATSRSGARAGAGEGLPPRHTAEPDAARLHEVVAGLDEALVAVALARRECDGEAYDAMWGEDGPASAATKVR